MGVSEYLPVALAATAAAAVAYIALSDMQRRIDAAAAADAEDAAAPPASARQQHVCAAHSSQQGSSTAAASTSSSTQPRDAISSAERDTAAASGASASSSSSSSGACDHCKKVPAQADQLLRCSRCHHARYCSKDCQRAAWSQHKRACRASNTSSPTAQQQQGAADAGGESASVMAALKHVLQVHAGSGAAGDDPLQQQFEQAVLLFVHGELRAAVAALAAVQAAAEAAGRTALAGDCCKWAGHAQLKLGDGGRAAAAFAAGCEHAEKAGNRRLQVDCLSGMGTMYRDAGQLAAAGGFLRQALRVADAAGDDGLRSGVLTLLGTVELQGGDVTGAIGHLEEAVALREDQVVTMHEAGQRGSALASAIMEHAGSLVSLAGAYYVGKQYADAAGAYMKSLAIFDMVEDVDKQKKCLVNLANLHELQLEGPEARGQAAQLRAALYSLASSDAGGGREAPDACAICTLPVSPLAPSEGDDGRLLVLGCAHCFHYACWEARSEHEDTCPSCKQPDEPAVPITAAQAACAKPPTQQQQQQQQQAKPPAPSSQQVAAA